MFRQQHLLAEHLLLGLEPADLLPDRRKIRRCFSSVLLDQYHASLDPLQIGGSFRACLRFHDGIDRVFLPPDVALKLGSYGRLPIVDLAIIWMQVECKDEAKFGQQLSSQLAKKVDGALSLLCGSADGERFVECFKVVCQFPHTIDGLCDHGLARIGRGFEPGANIDQNTDDAVAVADMLARKLDFLIDDEQPLVELEAPRQFSGLMRDELSLLPTFERRLKELISGLIHDRLREALGDLCSKIRTAQGAVAGRVT
ncbi:hypothetical protein U8P68_10785 [Rhizobium ruizarguesonis]|nr:hypothetical protein U8P68_10785 [Rhizobium ruizarguesonis]